MTAGAFPLLGALFVMLVALPALALVARGVLQITRRLSPDASLHGNTTLRYALLVLPPALPLLWLTSSAIRQAVVGACATVCSITHPVNLFCPEPIYFAAVVAAMILVGGLPAWIGFSRLGAVGVRSARERAIAQRVRRLLAGGPFEWLLDRLVVLDDADIAISTHGVWRPSVRVRADFADGLRDAELAAALAHEAEHIRAGDCWRYAFGWAVLKMNPAVWSVLGAELRRWIVSREVHCDREAVLHGADPLALAGALVTAARSARAEAPCCALATSEGDVLELRVALLLAYCERRPLRCCREPTLRITALALAGALLLPQFVGPGALNLLHAESERVANGLVGR